MAFKNRVQILWDHFYRAILCCCYSVLMYCLLRYHHIIITKNEILYTSHVYFFLKLLPATKEMHLKMPSAKSSDACKCLEPSGSVGGVLDCGSKGCWFEPRPQKSHCAVSLNKILYLLLSTDSTQEDLPRHD